MYRNRSDSINVNRRMSSPIVIVSSSGQKFDRLVRSQSDYQHRRSVNPNFDGGSERSNAREENAQIKVSKDSRRHG